MHQLGITTALQLADSNISMIRKNFDVIIERTTRELNGESCIALKDAPPPKQLILNSRSFGERVIKLEDMQQAIVLYATRAAKKLREQNSCCRHISVSIATARHGNEPQYSNTAPRICDYHVRDLTTNAGSEKARALSGVGAEVCQGNFDDKASLEQAVKGADAVFSLQLTDPSGQHREVIQAKSLTDVAKRNGVRHFIQSTVSGAGQHATADWFKSDKWSANYWNDKMAVQDEVRKAGFERYTILKPALFMENLLPPKAAGMYVGLNTGRLVSRIPASTKIAWISSETLASAVRFSLENTDVMNGCELELAYILATPAKVAVTLSRVTGSAVSYQYAESQTMLDMGFRLGVINAQEWQAEVGYPTLPDEAERLGISTSLSPGLGNDAQR